MPRAPARICAGSRRGSPYTRRTTTNTRVASNNYSLSSKTSYATKLPNEIKHMIAGYLPQEPLYQIAKCSTNWADVALPRLYQVDARSASPRAIIWAAKNCESHSQLALKVLLRSVKYKADVNAVYTDDGVHATALHYAAAYGQREFIQELLRQGARVDIRSTGYELARGLGIPILNDNLNNQFSWLEKYDSDYEWSPLVIPILKNDIETAELLVRAGAPATLIEHWDNVSFFNGLPIVTAYHLLAYHEPRDAAGWTHVFDNDIHRTALNVPMHNFSSALNTAVRNENSPIFDMLINMGADPDVRTVWGGSALVTAVEKAFALDLTLSRRKTMMMWMLRLIQAGAAVNPTDPHRESPLNCALKLYATTINAVEPCMKKVIEILVDNGADINRRGSDGETILHTYCRSLLCFQQLRYSSLETMLRYLIAKGGDVKARQRPGHHSLMFLSIRNIFMTGKVAPLHATLRDAGATLRRKEVSVIFHSWVKRPWFRKARAYNIFQHRRLLGQGQINSAWMEGIKTNDDKLCKTLQDQGLMPANHGYLLHQVIRGRVNKFWPKITDMGFDANCTNYDDHGSFLHTLVRQVQKQESTDDDDIYDDTISPKLAAEIAQTCIRKGTSSLIRDCHGKLALDLLPEGYPKLRAVLLEAYYQETKYTFT